MSRTNKDKPSKLRSTPWPYGLRTRWNDCRIHGKLCSDGSRHFKHTRLKRREYLDAYTATHDLQEHDYIPGEKLCYEGEDWQEEWEDSIYDWQEEWEDSIYEWKAWEEHDPYYAEEFYYQEQDFLF